MQARYRQQFKKEIASEINTLETERKRISADLHDDIGPVLVAAKMHLQAVQEGAGDSRPLVEKALACIDKINGVTRSCINSLMLPPVLQGRGLIEAAEQFIDTLDPTGSPHTSISGSLPPLRKEAATHLYRVVQEIIVNTCKHAGARRLEIMAEVKKNKLIIATADDGRGFDTTAAVLKKQAYGLLNIKSRVLLLNGSLHIESAPAAGTRYYIVIPLTGVAKEAPPPQAVN